MVNRKILAIFLAGNIIGCIITTVMFKNVISIAPINEEEAAFQPASFNNNNSSSLQNYWSLEASGMGHNFSCSISINLTEQSKSMVPKDMDNKIIIHIHGLHHTGTGFLRKTLLDELNNEFGPSAACMQDSLRPYQHLYTNKTELWLNHKKAEEEGQHLQNMYPPFFQRVKFFTKVGTSMESTAKLSYLADLCLSEHDDVQKKEQIGDILLQQWAKYWNYSHTTQFLLQKTPTLDVHFLESTKILPTFHVIIVRHPMTSNSFQLPFMAYPWANAYHHVFELLNEGKIEWYAVLTYEALLEYRDVVIEELMEVIRSGMKRFGLQSRRRLEFHKKNGVKMPPNSYLIPKSKSVELWKKCLERNPCRPLLTRLTKDVLPLFGYVSVNENDVSLVKRINDGNVKSLTPLTIDPAPVTVTEEYGRVLFSSEGDALKLLRRSNGKSVDDDSELMLKILESLKDIKP